VSLHGDHECRRASPSALGIDMIPGRLGTLAAVNIVLGWLTMADGGSAILSAERWAHCSG
jgi:hypothetical protein